MAMDRSFIEQNRASTERIRRLVSKLSDKQLQHPVGEHWTVAVALAHLAFWDRRVIFILDQTEHDGKLSAPEIDDLVNDISLPLWAAIPPREAARLAVDTAQELDKRLEEIPLELIEELYKYNQRWVLRALHRDEHLNEVDEALKR
jgi:Mycothiol maleylpyruvate isomerase N-terminal domain